MPVEGTNVIFLKQLFSEDNDKASISRVVFAIFAMAALVVFIREAWTANVVFSTWEMGELVALPYFINRGAAIGGMWAQRGQK
jgi:hypothetical protein